MIDTEPPETPPAPADTSIEPAEPVALSPVVNSTAPDAVFAGDVANEIEPD